ncbi:MAG: YigZ family protein, partial [Clostridia bacterium]|nr:YigZ family protein [Clostridia bacterium]
MERYLSIGGETQTEKIIDKSRFLTTSKHVCGEDEAKAFIEKMRSNYPDATHNCYAYICDNLGNFLRFSDDGEPQGTAGMPMLEVLKTNKLYEVAVVVTRYFGGVKLGAGGLVRAYSGCVAENIAAARKVSYEPCIESKISVDYPLTDSAVRFFNEISADVLGCEYLNDVTFSVAVKKSQETTFTAELLNRLCCKVKIQKIREYF